MGRKMFLVLLKVIDVRASDKPFKSNRIIHIILSCDYLSGWEHVS